MHPHTMMCLATALHCGTMLGTSAHTGHRAIKGLSITVSYFKPARITMTSLHGSVLRASAVTCILVLPPAVVLPWRFHWYRSTVSLTWGRPSSDHRACPAMPVGPAPPLRNALWLGIHAWFVGAQPHQVWPLGNLCACHSGMVLGTMSHITDDNESASLSFVCV